MVFWLLLFLCNDVVVVEILSVVAHAQGQLQDNNNMKQ